ncbi:MAG: hypothetical protein KC591_03960, partial [Gemmatimonadetes bacterium]|nr:hypothetical protein [Gemmatimonadota bacterium]
MTARSALVLGGSALLVAASLAGSRLVSRNSDPFAGLPYGPRDEVPSEEERMEEGHAWEMFDWWYGQRAFPHALIPQDGFGRAWTQRASVPRDPDLAGRATSWTSMGPNNVGGRMLAIALDPGQPGHVWAGSASGGLWFSSVGGEGPNAWTRVETGHPALSVSSIVIDPTDTSRIWIGTGEISRYERPLVGTPGARASYGMGVLRTTDGGSTWSTTGLNWTFDQYRAVIAMKGSESDPNLLYAATSEGLYKTTDAGVTWVNVHPLLMAMDVVIDPTNDSVVYVSHGQLGVPSAPDAGIYKSTNGGTTWSQVSNENWAGGQAWYDNAMAVSLANNDILVAAGLDCYRTTNGGANLSQVTFWWAG